MFVLKFDVALHIFHATRPMLTWNPAHCVAARLISDFHQMSASQGYYENSELCRNAISRR
jgi:hypothetical protein